ncbi:Hypothetical protein DPCES_2281 [Desulfitobacterium hafniense]|uniref:Uncharacterized protein n=1 Tax=Desulfitobacterium hafniense TaxID=49338 RepID=A0A098B017_DESHA|nr:Hypothetical protein DPCES_2281 [Desulfitobacterium hafniense]
MMTYILIAIGIVLLKSLMNLVKYLQCKRYSNQYLTWAVGGDDPSILQTKSQVIKLINSAGIEDVKIPWVQPMGYGKLSSFSAGVLLNYPSKQADMARITYYLFENAIGVYKSRIFEGFNPLFWVELFIFLPKNTLSYLGVSSEGLAVKLSQLIWWSVCAITSFAFAFLREDTLLLLRNWADAMLKQ